jgi:hypothetical protein
LQIVPLQHSKFATHDCPAVRHAPQVPPRQTEGAQQGVLVPHEAPLPTQPARSQRPLVHARPAQQGEVSPPLAPSATHTGTPQRPERQSLPAQQSAWPEQGAPLATQAQRLLVQAICPQQCKYDPQLCPASTQHRGDDGPARHETAPQHSDDEVHSERIGRHAVRSQTPLLQRRPGSQLTPSQHDAPTSPQRPGRHTPRPQ